MKAPFEVVETRDGSRAMRDRESGELMHPVGPLLEAAAIYVEPARLAERLQAGAVTLFDVGLGAGSNAAGAWLLSEARSWGPARTESSLPSPLAPLAARFACPSAHRLQIVS